MVRDEVREAIMASLQQATNSINLYKEPVQSDTDNIIPQDTPLSKFDLLDMAILKKFAKK